MAQRTIQILWDVERKRAVRSVYQPAPVSLAELFHGVSMGDTVSVFLSAVEVVGGKLRSFPVAGSPPTASLALYPEGDRIPAADSAYRFSDGVATTRDILYREVTAESVARSINALEDVQAGGGCMVAEVAPDHYEIRSRQRAAAPYSLTVEGDGAFIGLDQAGSATDQQVEHFWISPRLVGAPAVLTDSPTAPAVAVTSLEDGTASKGATQHVKVTGDVEGGTFRLGDGTAQTAPLAFDAAKGEIEEALELALSPATFAVEDAGRSAWDVFFVDFGAAALLQSDPEGLKTLQGVGGTWALTSDGYEEQGGPAGHRFDLECTVGTGAELETLFTEKVVIGAARG